MMRRAARLHPDQRRRELRKERLDLRAATPPPQYNLPTRIDPVHLEHVLRDIESDCDSLRHGRSPLLVRITSTPAWHVDAVGGRHPIIASEAKQSRATRTAFAAPGLLRRPFRGSSQ